MDAHRTITANEAQACLGIPASTIRTWASRKRLWAVGIDRNTEREYLLADVLDLRDKMRPRRHAQPARCRHGARNVA